MPKPSQTPPWQIVCHADDLQLNAGVAVRAHGAQVAIFLTENALYAIDNIDPSCSAAVLSRGIVGDINGRLVVASPMYKQHFCLTTGQCLEDETMSVRPWPVHRRPDGSIEIGPCDNSNQEDAHYAQQRV